MSFSDRGDRPPKPSSAQYGSINHDGRSKNTPSRSSKPAENDNPTFAYGAGDGPRIVRLSALPMLANTPSSAGPTSNGYTASPRIQPLVPSSSSTLNQKSLVPRSSTWNTWPRSAMYTSR